METTKYIGAIYICREREREGIMEKKMETTIAQYE